MAQGGGRLTRSEALDLLRRQKGADALEPSRWTCPVGPFRLQFPNFAWRMRAIAAHDLHHLMAGFPMTLRGEFQMAAWEFGAGRYPDWRATCFCMPLILVGLLWSPRRMLRAYRSGRRTSSLYPELDQMET